MVFLTWQYNVDEKSLEEAWCKSTMEKLSWASNFDKVGQKVGFSNAKVINNDYITTVVDKISCMKNWGSALYAFDIKMMAQGVHV